MNHYIGQELRVPDIAETLVVFRGWHINSSFDLVSPVASYRWLPGVQKAKSCSDANNQYVQAASPWIQKEAYDAPPHDVPGSTSRDILNQVQRATKECLFGCGFYGYYYPEVLPNGHGNVLGAIQVWGRVKLHAYGVRAEFARPVMLISNNRKNTSFMVRGRIRSAARKYDLVVCKKKNALDQATQYGQVITTPEHFKVIE